MNHPAQTNGTIVANLQKVGALRFYGPGPKVKGEPARLGELTEIPAGEEKLVPEKTWDRYKDRQDVQAMDRSKIVIGGFSSIEPGELDGSEAQRAAMKAHTQEMARQKTELEAMRSDIERREAELAAAMGGA